MKSVYLTFDVDLTDYNSGGSSDELKTAIPLISNFLIENNIPATWFIRIDKQIEILFGHENFIFENHRNIWNPLIDKGHQCAWHFHSYIKDGNKWKQNTNEKSICEELEKVFSSVVKNNWDTLRMGWAYHSNETFKTICNLGIKVDCSAFPRPNYAWEKSVRNWEITGQVPFFPSTTDYRISGEINYKTLQIPMNTVAISAASDTQNNVLRYINPVYHEKVFQTAIENCDNRNIVLVSHPYEVMPNKNKHGLMSFDFDIFKKNMLWIKNNFQLKTINRFNN